MSPQGRPTTAPGTACRGSASRWSRAPPAAPRVRRMGRDLHVHRQRARSPRRPTRGGSTCLSSTWRPTRPIPSRSARTRQIGLFDSRLIVAPEIVVVSSSPSRRSRHNTATTHDGTDRRDRVFRSTVVVPQHASSAENARWACSGLTDIHHQGFCPEAPRRRRGRHGAGPRSARGGSPGGGRFLEIMTGPDGQRPSGQARSVHCGQ